MIIKITKKSITILLIILLCLTMTPLKTVKASSEQNDAVEEELAIAREKIANYAESFYSKYRTQTIYDAGKRGDTYEGRLPSKTHPYFYFDCVGWVSYAINRATGIDYGPAHINYGESGSTGFVAPGGVRDTVHFVEINLKDAQRGDILRQGAEGRDHVAIYLGENKVCDMGQNGLLLRTLNGTLESNFSGAARLISLDGANYGALPDGTDISNIGAGTITATDVNLDDLDFKFSGMASDVTNVGGYSLEYYIDKIAEVFDYLLGIIFNGIKITVLAVVDGIYDIVTNTLESLSGM